MILSKSIDETQLFITNLRLPIDYQIENPSLLTYLLSELLFWITA
jgi:hypothetical protein